jgi:hypothetical protein
VSGSGSGVDFTFAIDVERFQRDLRYNNFVLLKRFEARLQKFSEMTLADAKSLVPIGVTGKLFEAVKMEQSRSNLSEGIFEFKVYIDEAIAPHWRYLEIGRGKGRSPFSRISEWVNFKWGYEGEDLWRVTRVIQFKLLKVGFDGNKAPYHFMYQANQKLTSTYLDQLTKELDLDVKAVWGAY